MNTYASIAAAIEANKAETHTTVGHFGDVRTEPNRTSVYRRPRVDDNGSTSIAYVETAYTYRGESWTTEAWLEITPARGWMVGSDKHGQAVQARALSAYNIDGRRAYRWLADRNLSEAQMKAAEDAIAAAAGLKFRDGGYALAKVGKREAFAWLENEASDQFERKFTSSHLGDEPEDYAQAARRNAEHYIREAAGYVGYGDTNRRVHGHEVTETDIERMAARLVTAHKKTLIARARAL